MHRQRLILKEDMKISLCGSHPPKYVEFSHLISRCCFAEDGREMYQEL